MDYPFSSPNGYEERLNQQFAGYLYYSLQFGPELLNRIHERSPLTFSDEAQVVAHQNAPLTEYTDEGPNREIDWVIGDEDKLVGYESKYGDSLGSTQLRDELEKLQLNADGRDVRLIAITPHTTPPGVLDRFEDDPVHWLSWNEVARRLGHPTESDVSAPQRPILRMLQDLFETEDMHPFTGFDHRDKLQYRYFIRDVRQELVDTELENPGKVNSSPTKDPEPTTWKRLVPKRLDVPFVRSTREEEWKRGRSYLTATVDTETHEVHTGIVFNVRNVERHQAFVADNRESLVDYAERHDLALWASMNSFNQWKVGVAETTDPSEMRRWLEGGGETDVMVDGTKYKKAIFVDACSATDPAELVQQARDQLLVFYEDFLVSDDIYPWATLADEE